jgi:hypothetical protein
MSRVSGTSLVLLMAGLLDQPFAPLGGRVGVDRQVRVARHE